VQESCLFPPSSPADFLCHVILYTYTSDTVLGVGQLGVVL